MTHFPQPHPDRRAARVQLGGSVLAGIRFEGGERGRAKLQTISETGGLLVLGTRLNEGDFIEIAFQTRSGLVHGMAEMLSPMRVYSDGCLQPFRFIAISDEDHRKLRMAVDSVMDSSFLGASSKHVTAVRGL
ncbi:MAG TPA: hypothetical protein VFJ47_15215 [Terriglobales bacterium]|nr:hypothetical protein [Terriglobales bacterium]